MDKGPFTWNHGILVYIEVFFFSLDIELATNQLQQEFLYLNACPTERSVARYLSQEKKN